MFVFFFKQKTAYEIYQCDWSSDVCSSDLVSSPASEVFGDRVKLDPGSTIYDVSYNTLVANPTSVLGAQTTPLALPVLTMPTPLTATPGTTDITVAAGTQQTLAPGAYDNLVVAQNATLTLQGGEYHFTSWTLGTGATIETDAPVDIRIQDDVTHSGSLTIGPSRASGLAADSVQITVLGTGNQPPVAFRAAGTIDAQIHAPNAPLWISGTITGRIIAKDIRLEPNSTTTPPNS